MGLEKLAAILRADPPQFISCRDAIALCDELGIAWQLTCDLEWTSAEFLVKIGGEDAPPLVGLYRWDGNRWLPLEGVTVERARTDAWDYVARWRQPGGRYWLVLSREARSIAVPLAPALEALLRAHGFSEAAAEKQTDAAVEPAVFATAILGLLGKAEIPGADEFARGCNPFIRAELAERLEAWRPLDPRPT